MKICRTVRRSKAQATGPRLSAPATFPKLILRFSTKVGHWSKHPLRMKNGTRPGRGGARGHSYETVPNRAPQHGA